MMVHSLANLKDGRGDPWAGQRRAKLASLANLKAMLSADSANFGLDPPTGSAEIHFEIQQLPADIE